MVVLAHPDIWIEFFKNKGKLIPSTGYKMILRILNNSQNLFAYNYEWNDYYESELLEAEDDTADFIDIFNNLLVQLNYQDRLFHENYGSIKNFNDLELCFSNSSNLQFLLINNEVNYLNSPAEKCSLILSKIEKPNSHWIYFSILESDSSHQLSVDYRDFRSNQEIQEFIHNLLNLKNPKSKRIYIQSDYLNFGSLFERVKGKRITYCSSEYQGIDKKNSPTLQAEKLSISTYFGNNASYIVSGNKSYLHPRAVFYNNLVLNMNHDFPQIVLGNENWHLTFHYCIEAYSEKLRIIKNYRAI
ncbi:hypothetical protein [Aquimarina litoralis]|uniref:hypothetical protein n=1 Tax=Aquimarina litoralis TaxID=584605 RepID=UPI001C562CB7|nr:hypothetical protein [Aquimarina litoralis]MBW1294360.1 hypothetical protein [Aquimarina litoralis]